MRKEKVNIIKFILLFVAIMVFAHSFVPHDHHYTSECETNHEDRHQDESPFHCHYFNNIVLHKSIVTNTVHKLLKNIKRYKSYANIWHWDNKNPDFYNHTFIFEFHTLISRYEPEIYPIRGSPCC